MLIVAHSSGHLRSEVCVLKVKDEILAEKLKLLELLLLVVDLLCVLNNAVPELGVVLAHILQLVAHVVLVHPGHLLVHGDLLVIITVRFFKGVVLLVQLVDIVKQLNVLLFSLDECSNDLVNVIDTSSFHYGLEGLLDNLGVTHVLIQQALLLFIFLRHCVQSNLQDLDRVLEFLLALALLRLHRPAQTLVVEFNFLVFLLELLLESLDIGLEGFLTLLMLALKSEDLVIGFRGLSPIVETFFVFAS